MTFGRNEKLLGAGLALALATSLFLGDLGITPLPPRVEAPCHKESESVQAMEQGILRTAEELSWHREFGGVPSAKVRRNAKYLPRLLEEARNELKTCIDAQGDDNA